MAARGAGETVCLVEDAAGVRAALARLLRALGYTVVALDSAEAFLDHLDGRPEGAAGVDCLVLDVRLPGISGLELQRRLAAAGGACASLPVVLISLDAAQVRGAALAAGAAAVVDKSRDGAAALAAAVSGAIRRPRCAPE